MTAAVNHAPITPALCHSERLVFQPKDAEEAIYIQKKLLEMGCKWNRHGAAVAEVEGCVAKGLLCEKGTIYYNPDRTRPYLICAAEQFDADYLPPDKVYLRDRFNELSARIDALAEKVDRIYEALYPDVDKTKPSLKKPRAG